MSELKRTQLYDVHVAAGATMVDFGGWEMPIQYPSGIIAEHLYTRQVCSLFDVSHMGRLLIEGPQRKEFLQHVLTSNVSALDLNMAQYCIIPNENGGAVDDAYLYLFQEDNYLLVVNAANIDKDLEHLNRALSGFDCTITNISDQWASIAVQGPKSKEMLMTLTGGVSPTKEPTKNSLGTSPARDKTASYVAWGHSIVCDPWSRVIRQCPSREAVAVTELDLSMVDSVRRQLPILSARREDVYRLTEL